MTALRSIHERCLSTLPSGPRYSGNPRNQRYPRVLSFQISHLWRHETEQLQAVIRHLKVIEDGGPPVCGRVLPLMKELLGLDRALGLELKAEGDTHRLGAFHWAGPAPGAFAREYDTLVSASPLGWGHFNPGRPEPLQRNRALFFAPLDDAGPGGQASPDGAQPSLSRETHARTFEFMRKNGVSGQWQLRVLVCEGDSLLAWIGGYRSEPMGRRECRLVQAITPALERRLSVDRLLSDGPLVRSGLTACLDEVSTAAFIVDAAGSVRHTNRLGRLRLDLEPSTTRAQLVAAVATAGASATDFRATPLGGPGLALHYLLVANSSGATRPSLANAARHWELTPRQAQVLALLLEGKANKTIAAQLDCAERTVEQHVTALLHKAGVDTRAALAAKFWKRS